MAASLLLLLSAAGVDHGVALATLMLKTVLIRACGVRAPYTDGAGADAGAGGGAGGGGSVRPASIYTCAQTKV